MRRTNFSAYVRQLSPTVLLGANGTRLMQGTLGVLFDMIAETFNQSVKAWVMKTNTHPRDALGYVGQERQLPRYGDRETDSSYRQRLIKAWDAWAQAGSPQELMAQLRLSSGLAFELREMRDWDWDGDSANWSRFWIIVTGSTWPVRKWGEFTYGTSGQWGVQGAVQEQRMFRSIVRQRKPAHVVCAAIIVVFDQDGWDADLPPDGTWSDISQRSPAASYWKG